MSGNGPTPMEIMRAEVTKAAPYIDAGPRKGWKASELIIIGFCMIASGAAGYEGAAAYADDMLAEARNRYAAGFFADPFMEPAMPRKAGVSSFASHRAQEVE